MMKIKVMLIVIISCISVLANGQNVDMQRMERDLEVAKNIMQTLLGQGENYFMWSRNIEASYLEGYGVIFTIPDEFGYAYTIKQGGVVVEETRRGEEVVVEEREKANQEKTQHFKDAVTTFLIDYSDLIGQLQPNEKIMIHSKARDNMLISIVGEGNNAWSLNEGGSSNFSAEILKKDVLDYKQGKINKDQVIGKIAFTEVKPEEKEQDLELFSSIVRRLYSEDLSKTFFTNRSPHYERLKGFGVIFYLSTYSSYENDRLYRMPVLRRDDVDADERRQTIEELFPKFEDELKVMLIEYGRTIKSLDEDEVILLKVKSTKCDGCNIPKSMELSVKKSVLTDFEQRKLSLENAKQLIKVQKQR